MKKLTAVAIICIATVAGYNNAYAEISDNGSNQLQAVNAQLTTALEQYASDASICSTLDFEAIGDQVNAAVDAGIAAGNSDATFDAQEAGKGLKLLMKHCASV